MKFKHATLVKEGGRQTEQTRKTLTFTAAVGTAYVLRCSPTNGSALRIEAP